ncbi:hypothetical protein HNQ07_003358 [Deinococcus metalli]|uniref:Uncharacterized protein n=1 Tax=Deinococcus metalli TaxID=1141878 RepID=A0A7W8KIL3_9DEIO|nr:hypothetical protein [Deinococcus metalli]MBB5377858.1 hypothetical protein [Deinococcus metalli]
MTKSLRAALGLTFALLVTAASAVPVGGYGLEKSASTSTSLSKAK